LIATGWRRVERDSGGRTRSLRSPRFARTGVRRLVADVNEALAWMGERAHERCHADPGAAPRAHDLAPRTRQHGVHLAVDHDVPLHAHTFICSR
jgi:hypothetical protein